MRQWIVCALTAMMTIASSPGQTPHFAEYDINLLATGSGGMAGHSVAAVGDLNSDGSEDFAIGAPFADPGSVTNAGLVKIVSGNSGATLMTLLGQSANERFGFRLANLGDVNGDGNSELAISSPGAATVRVVTALTGIQLYQVQLSLSFGYALANVGDYNGDGVNDLLAGSLGVGARLISGVDGSQLTLTTSSLPSAGIVRSVAGGDVNGDGIADLLTGNDLAIVSGQSQRGSATFYMSGGVPPRSFTGASAGDRFAASIAILPDYNADGLGELAFGATEAGSAGISQMGRGRVEIRNAMSSALVRTLIGDGPNDGFGSNISVIGDTDGDGVIEWSVSAQKGDRSKMADPAFSTVGTGINAVSATNSDAGYVRFFFDGVTGNQFRTYDGEFGDEFGASVASADVNGDGFPEAIVGASQATVSETGLASNVGDPLSNGRITVFSVPDRILRVAAKVVLGPGGVVPGGAATPWDSAAVQAMFHDANAILAANDSHMRLEMEPLETIFDPGLPVMDINGTLYSASWYDVDRGAFPGQAPGFTMVAMEQAAMRSPSRLKWRPDAINVYLVNSINPGNSSGLCSYPHNTVAGNQSPNDIFFITRILTATDPEGLLLVHELGHFLNLHHTHAAWDIANNGQNCTNPPMGGPGGVAIPIPSWNTSDCVWDTGEDTSLPFSAAGFFLRVLHDMNYANANVGLLTEFFNSVRYNVLSYHTPGAQVVGTPPVFTGPTRPILTPHQNLRMLRWLHQARTYVVEGFTRPQLIFATPVNSTFAGNYSAPQTVTLGGANLPTIAPTSAGYPAGGILPNSNLFPTGMTYGVSLGNGDLHDMFATTVMSNGMGGIDATFTQTPGGISNPVPPGRHDAVIFEMSASRTPRPVASQAEAIHVKPSITVEFDTATNSFTINIESSAPNTPMYLYYGTPLPEGLFTSPQAEHILWAEYSSLVELEAFTTDGAGRASFPAALGLIASGTIVTLQALEVVAPFRFTNPFTYVEP